MNYTPKEVIEAYTENAAEENETEDELSLRTAIPREFIRKYISSADRALDAGGGAGRNAALMASLCSSVTLLDITPRVLEYARQHLRDAGVEKIVELAEGDICDLRRFDDGSFSFVVCVGDALSYVRDRREQALGELVRVARSGAVLILGGDSLYGFLRMAIDEGRLDEAREMLDTGETYCGMGPRTHLYTAAEMEALLEQQGCDLLEAASTPSVSEFVNIGPYLEAGRWRDLLDLEMELCTRPELGGSGLHLLWVAKKR